MPSFACSSCSRTLRVDDSLSGKKARCPACRSLIRIPAADPPAGAELATLPPALPPTEQVTLPPPATSETATLPPATDPDATLAPSVKKPAGPRDDRAPPGYEVLGELGRGGMGVVYKARQIALNRVVALKMILAGGHAGADEMARFQTEAEAIARLQHPGIVQVFDVGEHEGRPYFSLEFCSGGSLEKKLAGTPLPPREAAQVVRALAEAMGAAHEAKVIHRDLKPANVLVAADGALKITDFGLAKKIDDQGQTASGAIMGTPSYMAPEQAGGKSKELGPAADTYALGAILYECLTGRPPFRAATPLDTILQVVSDEPVPPRQLNAKVPRDLEIVTLKCLQKEPAKRYASAKALADDLGRYLDGEPIKARPVGSIERAVKWARRRPAVAGLMAALVVAMLTLVGGGAAFTIGLLNALERARQETTKAERAEADARAAAGKEADARAAEEKQAEIARDEAKKAKDLAALAEERLQRSRAGTYNWGLQQAREVVARDPEAGRELLESAERFPVDLRDDAWAVLYRRAGPFRRAVLGHAGNTTIYTAMGLTDHYLYGLAFSPDSKRLADTCPWDSGSALVVRDADTGEERKRIKGKPADFLALAWLDNKTLVSGGRSGVALWDVESGEEKARLKDAKVMTTMALSRDGKTLATADKGVTLWDLAKREKIDVIDLPSPVLALAFSPSSKRLAISLQKKPSPWIRVYDLTRKDKETGYPIPATLAPLGDVRSLAFGDEDRLAFTIERTNGPSVEVWDVSRNLNLARMSGHARPPSVVAWRDEGREVLSLSAPDGEVKLWDARTGEERWKLRPASRRVERSFVGPIDASGEKVFGLAVSPDGRRLATVSYLHRSLCLYDLPGSEQEVLPATPGATIAYHSPTGRMARVTTGVVQVCLDVSRGEPIDVPEGFRYVLADDGKAIAFSDGDGQVSVHDLPSGKVRRRLKVGAVSHLALSPGGRYVCAQASPGTTVSTWDVETGEPLPEFQGYLYGCVFPPDGETVLVRAPKFGGVRWVDLKTGKARVETSSLLYFANNPTDPRPSGLAGERLLLLDGNRIDAYDTKDGKKLGGVAGMPSGAGIVYSPDGKRFAVNDRKTLSIAEMGMDKMAAVEGGTPLTPRAFSPEGKVLLAAEMAEFVVIDVEKKAQRGRMTLADGYTGFRPPTQPAFTADGKRVALHGSPGAVEVWDVEKVARHREYSAAGRGTPSRLLTLPLLSFLSKGRSLLLADSWGVCLWDVEGGAVLARVTDVTGCWADVSGDAVTILAGGKLLRLDGRGKERAPAVLVKGGMVQQAVLAGSALLATGVVRTLEVGERGKDEGHWALPVAGGTGLDTAAFSGDGKTLAVIQSQEVSLWDVVTRQRKGAWKAPRVSIHLAVSPSGDRVALGVDGAPDVEVFGATDGARQAVVKTGDAVRALAWSAGGETLAVGTSGKQTGPEFLSIRIRLHEARTGERRAELIEALPYGPGLAFSADGRTLFTMTRERIGDPKQPMRPDSVLRVRLRAWDVQTGQPRGDLSDREEADPYSSWRIACDAHGLTLYKQTAGNTQWRRWDWSGDRTTIRLNAPGGERGELVFSPDGSLLLERWAHVNSLRCWRTQDGQEVEGSPLNLGSRPWGRLSFDATGQTACLEVHGPQPAAVVVVTLSPLRVVARIPGYYAPILSPDGRRVVAIVPQNSLVSPGSLKVFDARDGSVLAQGGRHDACWGFTGDGKSVVVHEKVNEPVFLLDAATLKTRTPITDEAALLRDGDRQVWRSGPLWHRVVGGRVRASGLKDGGMPLASADGRRVWMGLANQRPALWDLEKKQWLRPYDRTAALLPETPTVSPDGRFAAVRDGGAILLWRLPE